MFLRHSKSILDFDYNRTTSEQTIYYNLLSFKGLACPDVTKSFQKYIYRETKTQGENLKNFEFNSMLWYFSEVLVISLKCSFFEEKK